MRIISIIDLMRIFYTKLDNKQKKTKTFCIKLDVSKIYSNQVSQVSRKKMAVKIFIPKKHTHSSFYPFHIPMGSPDEEKDTGRHNKVKYCLLEDMSQFFGRNCAHLIARKYSIPIIIFKNRCHVKSSLFCT